MEPSADAFAGIAERAVSTKHRLPDSMTLRADEGDWFAVSAGVGAKLLWHDPESHRRSLLVRVAAGATYESHGHPRHEECYVVDGDFSFGDHHLRRGDYHVAFQGGTHPMAHSRGGCLLLINEYSVAA